MSNKRSITYEIKLQGYDPLKGQILANPNQSLTSLRQRIQKDVNFPANSIYIQQPNIPNIKPQTKLIILREQSHSHNRIRARKQSEQSSIVFQQQSIIQRQKSSSQQFLFQEPQIPAKIIGKVKRCYKIFSCFSADRVMTLNYQCARFYYGDQENMNSLDCSIDLKNIKQISSYKKKNYYFLRIITIQNQNIDFKFLNKQICKQWISYFHKALQYLDYLSQKKNFSKVDSFQNFMKSLQLKQKQNIVKLQDSTFLPQTQVDYERQENKCVSSNTIFKSTAKVVRLADFKVSCEIGKGAFSTVYKAERQGKYYALKQINKDKLINQNQLKYAIIQLNILKKCNSKCPFIIPLTCSFQTQDFLYIAIKYLPFGTLKNVIQKRKTLTIKQATLIICQIIIAIQFLHENKILYRDMKPQNILMTQEGHIYLIDFGLSIQLTQEQQFAQSFVGTPLYLAPQRLQGSGKINYKADIYGVGCIFYLLLHGHAPYQAQSLASIIYNIKNTELKYRQDIDDITQDFLSKTLQSNVDKRLNHMSSHPLFQKIDWYKINRKQMQIMSVQKCEPQQMTATTGVGDRDYTQENYPNKKVNQWNYLGVF